MSDRHSEIVIDFSREMNDEEAFRILRKVFYAFPTFIREFGSLLVLSGVFGTLHQAHPTPATATLFAVTGFATFMFLANVFYYRLRVQFWKEETTRHQWWITKLFNVVAITASAYFAMQLYFDVRDLIAPAVAAQLPAAPTE